MPTFSRSILHICNRNTLPWPSPTSSDVESRILIMIGLGVVVPGCRVPSKSQQHGNGAAARRFPDARLGPHATYAGGTHSQQRNLAVEASRHSNEAEVEQQNEP